ncbi:MAG: serine O-acetyltransferase [Candidatus Methylopumilus sp.]|nr:serine O-acetyltransferase [Candidatus Methylopumilus sp.]
MLNKLRETIACILERDPAARSKLEVITCYPGFHAMVVHGVAHRLWVAQWFWLGRFISHLGRILTGIEIHPGATIGRRVFIDHGFGVVIGETAEIGDDCTIYQGVTLGGTRLYKGAKRHPTLGKGVVVGAGAQVLGGFTVGDGARIGSNAVVVKPVPAGATAVGNPARLIEAAPQTTDATAAHVQEPVAQSAQGTHSVQTTHNAQTMHVASATNTAQTTQTAEDRHSGEKQSISTPLSPCDADWDAAPLKALLDKGAPASGSPASADSASESAGFTAYAVDPGAGDPLVKVLHELINHAAAQDARIAQLCQTIEAMGSQVKGQTAPLDAQRLNKLVDE